MDHKIHVAESENEWTDLAVKKILTQGEKSIQNQGHYSLVLSGGSTPMPVYQKLAELPPQSSLDWNNVFIFWGDERCVPPSHQDSNYRMAKKLLLDQIPIPEINIFRMKGELPPSGAAQNYERLISQFFLGKEKRFDTILLGIGTDGHTASLFPGTPQLDITDQWVVTSQKTETKSMRITLTYPAINNTREILFLATGIEKSEIIADVIMHPNSPPFYPAKGIRGKDTSPIWIIDKKAADLLS